MASPHKDILRLRDIGWREWDPINLLPAGDKWESYPDFAYEYDPYLLEVAFRLLLDWSVSDAVEYLLIIECEHMGLTPNGASARRRAEATVQAIKALVD
jgi:hypothetical protein